MSTVAKTVCDVCGAIKGEGNKWLHVYLHQDCSYMMVEAQPSMANMDICSDSCLHKVVAKVVDKCRQSS